MQSHRPVHIDPDTAETLIIGWFDWVWKACFVAAAVLLLCLLIAGSGIGMLFGLAAILVLTGGVFMYLLQRQKHRMYPWGPVMINYLGLVHYRNAIAAQIEQNWPVSAREYEYTLQHTTGDTSDIWNVLAISYIHLRRDSEAEECWRQSLKVYPDQPEIIKYFREKGEDI